MVRLGTPFQFIDGDVLTISSHGREGHRKMDYLMSPLIRALIPYICFWKRKWQPTPVFLSGESHGQRSLAGYSP